MQKIDPNRPTQLNLIRVFLLPYLMKSPPKIDPNEIPTIADVVKMVVLNSIIAGSQFNYQRNEAITGPIPDIQNPNCILLKPTQIVYYIR
jgi:hypothetical protein